MTHIQHEVTIFGPCPTYLLLTVSVGQLPSPPPRLHEVQPLAMVDLSVGCFPHILPWEVAIACGIDQSNEDMVSHDPQQLVTMATSATPCQAPERVTFGKFLSQCLQDEQTNPATMEVFQSDPDLMMLSLSVLLQLGPSKTCLQTPDGNPAYVGLLKWETKACSPPNKPIESREVKVHHVRSCMVEHSGSG